MIGRAIAAVLLWAGIMLFNFAPARAGDGDACPCDPSSVSKTCADILAQNSAFLSQCVLTSFFGDDSAEFCGSVVFDLAGQTSCGNDMHVYCAGVQGIQLGCDLACANGKSDVCDRCSKTMPLLLSWFCPTPGKSTVLNTKCGQYEAAATACHANCNSKSGSDKDTCNYGCGQLDDLKSLCQGGTLSRIKPGSPVGKRPLPKPNST